MIEVDKKENIQKMIHFLVQEQCYHVKKLDENMYMLSDDLWNSILKKPFFRESYCTLIVIFSDIPTAFENHGRYGKGTKDIEWSQFDKYYDNLYNFTREIMQQKVVRQLAEGRMQNLLGLSLDSVIRNKDF